MAVMTIDRIVELGGWPYAAGRIAKLVTFTGPASLASGKATVSLTALGLSRVVNVWTVHADNNDDVDFPVVAGNRLEDANAFAQFSGASPVLEWLAGTHEMKFWSDGSSMASADLSSLTFTAIVIGIP